MPSCLLNSLNSMRSHSASLACIKLHDPWMLHACSIHVACSMTMHGITWVVNTSRTKQCGTTTTDLSIQVTYGGSRSLDSTCRYRNVCKACMTWFYLRTIWNYADCMIPQNYIRLAESKWLL